MKKITSQIKFIGGALSLIIITILLSILYINEQSKSDSIVINISGKQRMLSQKISKEVFHLLRIENIDTTSLKDSTLEFDKNLKDLIKGNLEKNIYKPPTQNIKDQLQRVKNIWIDFKKNVDNFEKNLKIITEEREFVFDKNRDLLEFSDEIVKEMVKEGISGEFIDIAGRQRMLSQRMMYHLLLYLNTSNPKYYSIFFEAYKIYDETIQKLSVNSELTKIKSLNEKITNDFNFWKLYSKRAKKLIEMQSKNYKIVAYVNDYNLMLLDTMDSAVSMYTNYSQNQRLLIQKIEYFLGLIALLIMLYSWFLTRNIEQNFETFLNQSKSLIKIIEDKEEKKKTSECEKNNELFQATSHLNDFISKIDLMILDAQKAIQSSEKISQEISNVSDEIEKDLKLLDIDKDRKKEITHFIDNSEDIAIQSIEELQNSAKLLQKLHENLHKFTKRETE